MGLIHHHFEESPTIGLASNNNIITVSTFKPEKCYTRQMYMITVYLLGNCSFIKLVH